MKIPLHLPVTVLLLSVLGCSASLGENTKMAPWSLGTPITTYWAGPGFPGGGPLDDAAARQLAEGGWNLVWCHEKELDVAHRHGLRGLLTDPLLEPGSLEDPARRAALEALISRVSGHPALYSYHLVDEPSAVLFPKLGALVAFLRERDAAHFSYINLLPTYASNAQLGTKGGVVEAYADHLRQYVAKVRPSLLSYDHYQFTRSGDNPDYFLNLSMIREQAQEARVPFMNIVQASSWVPSAAASPQSPRVPGGPEMRYLVYSSLAYGAQAISYYVYGYPAHEGGVAGPDGRPTELYPVLSQLNREFMAIAGELQPRASLGVFHAGMMPPGTLPIPADFPITFDPPVPAMPYKPGDRLQGVILGRFGKETRTGHPGTYFVVVNPDYATARTITLCGPQAWELFDAMEKKWSPVGSHRAELTLAGGAGKLLRLIEPPVQ